MTWSPVQTSENDDTQIGRDTLIGKGEMSKFCSFE